MNYQELLLTSIDEYGKDSPDWIARYTRFINRGQREICNEKDYWPFLLDTENSFNTSANEKDYTLTETNIKKLAGMRITTSGYQKRLAPIKYEQYLELNPYVDESVDIGTPEYYTTTNRSATNQVNIILYPVPDAVYAINYDFLKEPTEMASDSDVPVFPTAYHDLLIDYVLWKSYQHDNKSQQAAIYRAHFKDGLRKMMGDYMIPETGELTYIEYDGEEVEQ